MLFSFESETNSPCRYASASDATTKSGKGILSTGVQAGIDCFAMLTPAHSSTDMSSSEIDNSINNNGYLQAMISQVTQSFMQQASFKQVTQQVQDKKPLQSLSNSNKHSYQNYLDNFPMARKQSKYRSITSNQSGTSVSTPLLAFEALTKKRICLHEISEGLLLAPDHSIKYIERVNVADLFGEIAYSTTAGAAQTMNSLKQTVSKEQPLAQLKIKKRMNVQTAMLESLQIESIVTCPSITEIVGEKINQKYILFLKGKYRALKCFNSADQTRYSSKLLATIGGFLGNIYGGCDAAVTASTASTASDSPLNNLQSSSGVSLQLQVQSSEIISGSSSSSSSACSPLDSGAKPTYLVNFESKQSHAMLCDRKQIFHNLSKYMMHLILVLLSDDHLNEFGLAAGYDSVIRGVIQNLRESGKRNKFSQTYYFNHSHYNCFFLVVTEQNKDKLRSMPEYMKIQERVFGKIDFDDTRALLDLNILKLAIGRLVQMQIRHLLDQVDQVFDPRIFELDNIQTDCQAKGFYLRSVYEGITKLLAGQYLIRF